MAKILVVGSGVVGAATGRGLHRAGHDVTFIDIIPDKVQQLRNQGLRAHEAVILEQAPTVIFLTLPTPHAGRRYDLTTLASGVAAVGRAIRDSSSIHTVVVRSTVPPGTTEGMVKPILEAESGKVADKDFALACNPEFLRAASAEDDFCHPWMTVIASRDSQTCKQLGDILSPFGGEMRFFDNPATAELIKCSHNIFNATKISFWNEMWLVARSIGIDLMDVSSTVALSAEGSFNPQYGIRGGAPYGGACLPKDTNGFLGFAAERGLNMALLEAVVSVNEQLCSLQGEEIEALLGDPAPPDSATDLLQTPGWVTSLDSNGRIHDLTQAGRLHEYEAPRNAASRVADVLRPGQQELGIAAEESPC